MYFVSHEAQEKVPIETLDSFCERNGISHIDFLKIDTEGFDLNIMLGAGGMLARHCVDLVQAEVLMNADNKYHVPFSDVRQHLESFGYRLFGIYEQGVEWGMNIPIIRRANVVYISRTVSQNNPLWVNH